MSKQTNNASVILICCECRTRTNAVRPVWPPPPRDTACVVLSRIHGFAGPPRQRNRQPRHRAQSDSTQLCALVARRMVLIGRGRACHMQACCLHAPSPRGHGHLEAKIVCHTARTVTRRRRLSREHGLRSAACLSTALRCPETVNAETSSRLTQGLAMKLRSRPFSYAGAGEALREFALVWFVLEEPSSFGRAQTEEALR